MPTARSSATDGGRQPRCRSLLTSRHHRRPMITPAGPKRTGPLGRRGSRRLRARFAAHNVEAYFGVRRENTRYLTGFVLGEGEEKVAGHSGQFLVGGERGRRPRRLALHDPGRAGGEGRSDRGRGLRPAGEVGVARGICRCQAGGRRGGVRISRALAPAGGGGTGRRARPGRRLDRGGSRDQGGGRGRADCGRVRGRRSCARVAPATDQAGRAPRPLSRSSWSGSSGRAARRPSPSTRPVSQARRQPCRMDRPGRHR